MAMTNGNYDCNYRKKKGEKGKDGKRPISNEQERKGRKDKKSSGAEEDEEGAQEEVPKMSEEEIKLMQR